MDEREVHILSVCMYLDPSRLLGGGHRGGCKGAAITKSQTVPYVILVWMKLEVVEEH